MEKVQGRGESRKGLRRTAAVERVCSLLGFEQRSANLLLKGQVVNSLGFVGHIDSITATQPCPGLSIVKAAILNIHM